MTAPVRPSDLKLDPVEVFRARCEARALLWRANEFGLHEAVDKLRHDAERGGLVERIGQDRVQAIMAAAFHTVRDTVAADPEMVPDALPEADGRGAPRSTVEAVVYALREYGRDALRRGNTRARLAGLSNRQIEAVIARLRMRGKCPRITDDLLSLLAELLP